MARENRKTQTDITIGNYDFAVEWHAGQRVDYGQRKEGRIMAKLSLRGAKGTGGGKSKAKAARKKGGGKGGRRGGKARGGIPGGSGDRSSTSESDTSFSFGANQF